MGLKTQARSHCKRLQDQKGLACSCHLHVATDPTKIPKHTEASPVLQAAAGCILTIKPDRHPTHSRQECNSPHAFPASPCQHETSFLNAYADLLAPGAAQDNLGEGNGSSGPRRGQHQCIATRSSSGRMYPLPKRRPSQRRGGRCEVALHVWFVHIDLWDGPAFFWLHPTEMLECSRRRAMLLLRTVSGWVRGRE